MIIASSAYEYHSSTNEIDSVRRVETRNVTTIQSVYYLEKERERNGIQRTNLASLVKSGRRCDQSLQVLTKKHIKNNGTKKIRFTWILSKSENYGVNNEYRVFLIVAIHSHCKTWTSQRYKIICLILLNERKLWMLGKNVWNYSILCVFILIRSSRKKQSNLVFI